PATAAAAGRATGYTAFLDADALAGARIGVWRDGFAPAGAATAALADAALAVLAGRGATLVDPVELPGTAEISEPELSALLTEFAHDLNAYLAALPGEHPATLAELIAYNQGHAATVLARFGQELFERAEATGGDLADPGYLAARGEASRLARAALDGPLGEHRLDAIVTLTASPAWLTDYHLGDHDVFHTSGPAAVAGYPAICVPAGGVFGLPVGLSFIGPAWSEPRLIALAYAFEQAAAARLRPTLSATCPPPSAAGPGARG
ncbi:MAG TPA: amidase family protein, partial [Streptosporangiaceae bacterium]